MSTTDHTLEANCPKLVGIYRNTSFKILDVIVSGYTLSLGVLMTMWQKTTKHSSRKLESL